MRSILTAVVALFSCSCCGPLVCQEGLSSVDWSLLLAFSLSVRWHWLVLALPRYLEFHMLHKESEYFSKIILHVIPPLNNKITLGDTYI